MKIGVPLRKESQVLAVANNDLAFVTTQFSMEEFIIIYRLYPLYEVCFGYAKFTDYTRSDEPLLNIIL